MATRRKVRRFRLGPDIVRGDRTVPRGTCPRLVEPDYSNRTPLPPAWPGRAHAIFWQQGGVRLRTGRAVRGVLSSGACSSSWPLCPEVRRAHSLCLVLTVSTGTPFSRLWESSDTLQRRLARAEVQVSVALRAGRCGPVMTAAGGNARVGMVTAV